MELTTENMNKLIEWQKDGRRCVKITIDAKEMVIIQERPIKICAYDYDLQSWFSINEVSELPTIEEMEIEALKTKKQEVQELEDRLKSRSESEGLRASLAFREGGI